MLLVYPKSADTKRFSFRVVATLYLYRAVGRPLLSNKRLDAESSNDGKSNHEKIELKLLRAKRAVCTLFRLNSHWIDSLRQFQGAQAGQTVPSCLVVKLPHHAITPMVLYQECR